jgi:hypothetical protein
MSKITLEECIDRLREAGAQIAINPPAESPFTMHLEHVQPFTTPKGRRLPGKSGATGGKADPHTVIAGELPPWGQMDDTLFAEILPPIPLDWRLRDGTQPSCDDWWEWLLAIVQDIGFLIWPAYAPGAWTDATVGRMLDADFTLLAALRWNIGLPINSVSPTIVQHGDLFTEEDDGKTAFGTGYERYDPTLPKQVVDCLPTVMTAGIVDKVGSLDLQLKLFFQRPRAYQVALLQSRKGFSYQSANTANSPSLVSGHCLQSSLAGCTAFAAFAVSSNLNATSIKVLQQFTVDIGDRRVFAGVHYPSDNLSSWFTALKLVPRVFDAQVAPDIKAFLWEAINSRSIVYNAIKEHARSNAVSPYKPAVEALEKLGSGEP